MLRRFLWLLLLLPAAAYAQTVMLGSYGPTGKVRVTRPTLNWNVWRKDRTPISSVDLTINDRPVQATYDAASQSVEFVPPTPLGSGHYRVRCTVGVNGRPAARQDWTFDVAEGARDLPQPDQRQLDGIAALNRLRATLGLPEVTVDESLCAAASAHSHYNFVNNDSTHVEDENAKDFVGKMPWDRAAAFGFAGSCYEDLCVSNKSHDEAISLLFDAPYHRIAFMQPGSIRAGVGVERTSLTINFGMSQQVGIVTSPASEQTGIPTTWDGIEYPSPLWVHKAQGPVGYPIVFSYFTRELAGIKLASAQLFDESGNVVPVLVNHPGNDQEVRYSVVIIPAKPLLSNSSYRAVVKAVGDDGSKLERTWGFTTGAR